MSELIKLQFELSRDGLLKDLEGVSPEALDVQPEGFNNNIRWHLGHILSATEQFMFGRNGQLPAEYNDYFGYGSKPANWTGDVPAADVLVDQLKSQLSRIKEIPNEVFANKLPKQILGQNTVGELAALASYHEANHCGQIHAMLRVVK